MPRLPDWHCATCNMSVFGSKPACSKCGARNPGNQGAPHSAASGDWTCPQCNDKVFASRAHCRQCGTGRPTVPAPAQAAGRAPDWHCAKCNMTIFGSKPSCAKCGTPNPHRTALAAPQQPQAADPPRASTTTRLPDWHCASCNMTIFGSKPACAKCGAPNPGLRSTLKHNVHAMPGLERGAAMAALDSRVGILPPWYWDVDTTFPTPGRTTRRAVSDVADLAALQAIMTPAFKIKRAWWLQNDSVWVHFATTRSLLPHSAKDGTASVLNARTMSGETERWSTVLTTHAPVNELLLLHGTKPDTVPIICGEGFDERVCRLSGLFGAGLYFTDVPEKAHGYTQADSQGTRFMFLARVCMGHAKATMTRTSDRRAPQGFDSVVGRAAAGAAREFVVYDRRMTYPEVLIEYA